MRLFPKSSLGQNIGWMAIGQGSGFALRAIYFIVIARLLGVVQYGVVVGAFALVNIVAQYSRAGSGMVLLRYVSADHRRFAAYWANVLVTTGVMSGVIILGLYLFAPRLLDPASAGIVFLTALGSCFFEQLTISATQVFQAFERGSITALFNQLTSLSRAIVAVSMLVIMHHATAVQWALASTVVAAGVAAAALILVTVKYGRPQLNRSLLFKRTGEGIEYAFAASTTNVYDDLDKVMLSHYGMNAANGIYAMAYRIIEMATSPVAAVQLGAEPRLFKLGESNPEGAYQLGFRLLKHGLLLSAGIGALLFFTAPILPRFVGKEFSEGVSAVRWLCLIPIFRSIHYMTGSVLTAIGKQRYRTLNQAVVAVFNFSANLWLIPHFGWRGAAWSSLATDCLLSGMNAVVLRFILMRTEELAPSPAP